MWFPYWDGRPMGAEAVNLWKGRDEEGKKEMKVNQPLPEELEEPRVERTWGGGAGGAGLRSHGWKGRVAGLGCWPGSRGVERTGSRCGSGRRALQRRGQDAGCRELRGGWGRAEGRDVGQASGQEQCVQRPSARRPGSRLERSGQGTLVIPWLLTFPGQLKA